MRKFLALALALIMILSLATTAFAADGEEGEEGPYTVTINNATGHTYKIYQIFTGDLSTNEANEEVLSNIVFGTDYLPQKGVDANGEMTNYAVGEEVPDSFLANPTQITPTGAGTAMTPSEDGKTATASGLVAGYYMIVDVTDSLPDGDSKSAVIFQVVGDTEVTSKHDSTPKTYKKIDDKNDSTGAEDKIVWHDSADHDIGDLIDFQLNAVIPSSIEVFREYNEDKDEEAKMPYRFVFHDVEEQGLTFASITSVYVWNDTNNDEIIDEGEKTDITAYSLVQNPDHNKDGNADCTFDVVFEDLTTIEAISGGSVLVVEYRSRLNEKAVIGEDGNVNKMRGEYSNFNKPEEPSFTPWDNVIAFTYKVVVNKVDEAGDALEGAEFTLEKFVKVLPEGKNATETVYAAEDNQTIVGYWIAVDQVETVPGTVFTFKGLDDGNYRLTETETPDGYNTIKPIEFTVTANHFIEWEDQDRTEVLDSLTGNKVVGEIEFEVDTEDEDALTADVENKSGTVLPETGGMGTTIFYAVGGVLAVAAVVLLVTKKRASSAK